MDACLQGHSTRSRPSLPLSMPWQSFGVPADWSPAQSPGQSSGMNLKVMGWHPKWVTFGVDQAPARGR